MSHLGVHIESGDGWMCTRFEQDLRSFCMELRPGFDYEDDETEMVEKVVRKGKRRRIVPVEAVFSNDDIRRCIRIG